MKALLSSVLFSLFLISCSQNKKKSNIENEKYLKNKNTAKIYNERRTIFLSDKPVVEYLSKDGESLLKNSDSLSSFLMLSEHYGGQAYLSTCGPASIRIVLSALYKKLNKPFLIDDERSFFKDRNARDGFFFGITERNSFSYIVNPESEFDDYNYIARQKNGKFGGGMGGVHAAKVFNSHKGISAVFYEVKTETNSVTESEYLSMIDNKKDCTKDCKILQTSTNINIGIESFRGVLKKYVNTGDGFIIAYFSHIKTVPGLTSGHFAPIAAYNGKKDMVLIMDVASHLGGWYWIGVEDLYKSMLYEVSGMTRGYIVAEPTKDIVLI